MDTDEPVRSETNWRAIYIAVVITTFAVVTALWAFSRYFSS
jgi:hypothetical protein